jgi:hypothetical protein
MTAAHCFRAVGCLFEHSWHYFKRAPSESEPLRRKCRRCGREQIVRHIGGYTWQPFDVAETDQTPGVNP